MAKVLGLDYGTKRVGVAMSDELGMLAREIGVWDAETFLVKLKEFLQQNVEVESVVVGLPLNMDGQDTQKTQEARAFAERVEKSTGLPTTLTDERLSSDMARNLARGGDYVDGIAAQIILQTYLDKQKS